MMPIPIRQMFITPGKISFTLSQSNEINTIKHELIDTFLRGAKVDVLWLEMLGNETEPIEFLQQLVQKTTFSEVGCLKLGSSKVECDVAKLTNLMKDLRCAELIVDWRFQVPEAFFKELHIEQLSRLTIGNQEPRNFYIPLAGDTFELFRGDWMEIGPNRLTTSDVSKLLKNWKLGFIHWISMYNIVISFPVSELLVLLKNEACQRTQTRWTVSRDVDGVREELDIGFFQNTGFSKNPSIVIKQYRNLEDSW